MEGGRPVITYGAEGRVDDVLDVLVTSGFVIEAATPVRIDVLDTFDGRLHRRGRRLRAEHGRRIDLVLSVDGRDVARTGVDTVPRTADELPPGDPWDGAAELVGVRVLQPRLVLRATRRRAYRRNSTGAVVAVADLLDDLELDGQRRARTFTGTVELRAIGRTAKSVLRLADELSAAGLERHEHDTIESCAMVAGVELGGFTVPPPTRLDAGMSALDGVRAILTPLATAITAQWDGTIDRIDTEYLHQLRVAVRRTRTILGVASAVLPADVHGRVVADVAWLASLTSAPRDLDVCLLNWSADTGAFDADTAFAAGPIRDVLGRRRDESHELLATAMRSRRARSFRTDWSRWLAEPSVVGAPVGAGQPLGPFVGEVVQRGHRQLVRDGRAIDDRSPAAELHELRKDAKRLRYLVDGFAPILPSDEVARLIAPLKVLQEVLGRHQDADVHAAVLASTAPVLVDDGASPATLIALGRMLERMDDQRRRARDEFDMAFARFDRPKVRRAVSAIVDPLS